MLQHAPAECLHSTTVFLFLSSQSGIFSEKVSWMRLAAPALSFCQKAMLASVFGAFGLMDVSKTQVGILIALQVRLKVEAKLTTTAQCFRLCLK